MRLFFCDFVLCSIRARTCCRALIVEGEGQVNRAPDHAVIEASLPEQGCDAGAILLELRTRVDSVIDALKRNGIDENTSRPRG